MLIQTYQPHELHFAYCYRVYFRWRTFRNRLYPALGLLSSEELNELMQPYCIRVLECAASEIDVTTMVSLQPAETISACASKLKGRVSKWLGTRLRLAEPDHLLSRGYFACTVGQTTTTLVEQYLETQGAHHGYDKRLLPPIFVERYELTASNEERLNAKHAYVVAQFHVVLATRWRRGVLGSREGRRIASAWRNLQQELRIAIIKVSFVPDHVHIALRMHPAVSPADVVAALMNTAQETIREELIPAGLDRLWEPSAYLGSYGDLASPQIRKYIERLRRGSEQRT